MKIQHNEDYVPLRKKEYPAIGEQLDALMKLAQALQTQGIELPSETLEWISKCNKVKTKFKKT